MLELNIRSLYYIVVALVFSIKTSSVFYVLKMLEKLIEQ